MSEKRIIRLFPLTFVPEDEGIAIGRFGTDAYAVFPEDGAELVKQLQQGLTLDEAAAWYEATYGEEIDMEDFISTLRELQFLREDHSDALLEQRVPGQWLGRVIFSPVAWFAYVLLAVGCVVLLVRYPVLRPHYASLFFTPYLLMMQIVLFVGQIPGLLVHEGMHILAGRRSGIPSRLGIGRRMYFFVVESSMPGLWGLERKARYLPLLAGMLGDVIWFSLLTMAASMVLDKPGLWHQVGTACLALGYTTVLRFIWQFYFYLQTDIYYVLITALRCINLQQTTREYVRNRWHRLRGAQQRMTDESHWSSRDLAVARWYAPVYLIGWLVMASVLVFVGLPVMWRVASHVAVNLKQAGSLSFWDSAVFLILNGVQYGLVLFVYVKERKAKKRRDSSWQVPFSQEG